MAQFEQKADFRPDINALRAIAVLGVVAYHYGMPGFAGGFAGVDVFFVISGYLIGGQIFAAHGRGKFSFAAFFLSRLRRIFPALALLVVACLAWMWWHALPYDYLKTTRHAVAALFFLSNLAFTGEQGYFDLAAHAKPLLHTWSLSVEGQFYLFLPVLFSLAWRFARHRLGSLLVLALFASLTLCMLGGRSESADAFYLLLPRAWEFLAGALLAWFAQQTSGLARSNGLALVGLLALLVAFSGLDAESVWPGFWTLLPVLAAVGLIAAGRSAWLAPLLQSWPLQRLGDVSYSLYLWHWPVLVFARQYSEGLSVSLNAGHLSGLALFSLLLAWASWRWVEQPIRSRTQFWTTRRVWCGVASVLLLVFAFGLMVVKGRGVPERMPAYVQRASAAVFYDTPRDDCFRNPDSRRKLAVQFCRFEESSPVVPSLLLWGDSHANQYLASLADAAQVIGQNGLIATQGGCRASPAGESLGLPASIAQACQNFNQEVHALLTQTPSIRTVVLGRVWGNDASVGQTLRLVQQLLAQGKSVVLIGPLSQPGVDVPHHWSMRQIQAGQAIDEIGQDVRTQTAIFALRERLQTALADPIARKQLVLIDPLQHLCDAQSCWLVKSGEANFRDTSHLSKSAALAYTPDFAQALKTLGY